MGQLSRLSIASRRFWLVSVLLLLSFSAQAGLLNFHHYDVQDGLPQTQVLSIHQDYRGYLWFGTYGGVSRYNGVQFETFTTASGLGANAVEAIASDPDGTIWVATGAGVCKKSAGEARFSCLDVPGLDEAYVYDLHLDPERLWVASNRGLFRVQGELYQQYTDKDGLPVSSVQSVVTLSDGTVVAGTVEGIAQQPPQDDGFSIPEGGAELTVATMLARDGKVWLGTTAGLFVYYQGSIFVSPLPSGKSGAVDIVSLALGQDDDLWVASGYGVYQLASNGIRQITTESGLADNNVHSVFVDREGLAWMGHDYGLSKLVPGPFRGYDSSNGMHHDFVRAIAEDERHRLWLGTRQGVQVVPKTDEGWDFQRSLLILSEDGLSDPRIFSIDFPAPGEALIATVNGLNHWREGEGIIARYFDQDGLPGNRTLSVFVDSLDRAWIGTREGIVRFDGGEILPPPTHLEEVSYPIRFKEDAHGRLWIATVDEGAYVYDDSGGESDTLTQYNAGNGLTGETIWDMAPDESGGMWLASNGDGLFHVTGDGNINRYSVEDGLVDNFGWQVIRDRQGQVWVYTNRGLSRLDSDGNFRNFGLEDGLLHLEGGATTAVECHTGHIWFGSADGLVQYDPMHDHLNVAAPLPRVESVELEGERIEAGSEIPHGAGSLDFHFASLSFQAEDAVRYRYRLKGVSEQWNELESHRPVTYGNLGGGDYVFEVTASNAHGVWSEEAASFPFKVKPPIWATLWFWLAVAPATIGLFWAGVSLRWRQLDVRRRELETLVRDRTRDLEAANSQLAAAAITDPLTGLKNRRYLHNQIGTDVAQTRRAYAGNAEHPNRDIVFMMVDLDHFKEINDCCGHKAGDQILKAYAEIIDDELRDSDYVVRWGGEEFLIVARQTEAARCRVMVERIRERASNHRCQIEGEGRDLSCSCSIGVSHLPFLPGEPDVFSWEQIVDIADVAVYLAKWLGRDGWVAIHGTDKSDVSDPAEFIWRLKHDLSGLVGESQVELEASFEDVSAVIAKRDSK